jgi:hypothetical protein
MHPMFVKLFIEPDNDDLLAEDSGSRRHGRRAKRRRPAMVTRAATPPQRPRGAPRRV